MQRVLLVTGGGRGIGAATARLAAAKGYAVGINYRSDQVAARSVAEAIYNTGGRAALIQGDVASEADVVRLFEEVEGQLGPLTHLVNSAGISLPPARCADLEADALARLLAVNVQGLILCCREAVKRMSTAKSGAGGVIVNVGSMASTIGGRPGRTAYAASKGAVDAFSIGLAREVAAEGIRVNVLRPGMTRSDMTRRVHDDPDELARVQATIAMGRTAEVEEMARAILFLLSDDAAFVSGATLDASGGGYVFG